MKVYNLLLGLQNHASSYPCPYCKSPKNWKSGSALRTFGRIREKARQFHSSEATKKEAKYFFNCVKAPLLHFSDETLVLAKICIPELHLLLGVVNRIFDQLSKNFCEERMFEWARENQINRASYRGGRFEGKPCVKILQKAEDLKNFLPSKFKPYADCLKAFKVIGKEKLLWRRVKPYVPNLHQRIWETLFSSSNSHLP